MDNVLVSICISSYNHGDKCVRLINRILSVKDERFNIVVCDDCSNEDTVKQLKSLSDSKVTLIQNEKNLGACGNWFKTIDSGTGEYVLHVLDRDTISTDFLSIIFDVLEKKSVGGGYFGRSDLYPVKEMKKKTSYAICGKGREAFLTMAGVPIHPTGFLVKRTAWKMGRYKKFFSQSEKYGIYPHSYVLGELAVRCNLIYSPIPFYSFTYRGSNKISRFYSKKGDSKYWWLPKNAIETDNRLMLYLSKIADNSYKEEFIYRRFKDALSRATWIYKRVMASQQEMEHYGLTAKYISEKELLQISIEYAVIYIHILKKMNMNKRRVRKQLKNIWLENLEAILIAMKGKSIDKVLSLSNRNLLYFQMMNQWIKVKQRYNDLSKYFKEKGYAHIAIYGMGAIGQTLLDELWKTDVEVVYGIDRNANCVYTEVIVLSLVDNLPEVDVIVVTVVESFDVIVQSLQKKVNCPIISLRDIIFDI